MVRLGADAVCLVLDGTVAVVVWLCRGATGVLMAAQEVVHRGRDDGH